MNSLTNWQKQIATSFEREARQVIIDRVSPSDFRYRKCESPIEVAYAVAFDLMHGLWRGPANSSSTLWAANTAPMIFLEPQVQVDGFRVDFVCGWNVGSDRFTSIAIECDGHDFHERTKKQAAADKSRDRALSSQFARVIRFTGSEIYADPCKCASETLQLADELFWGWFETKNGGL